MIDSEVSVNSQQPATQTDDQMTAGAMLRQLREDAGVDPVRVASAMKVTLQKLEALENDRYDELPDLTFARALASAICRVFDVNPGPVLARMPVTAPGLQVPNMIHQQPLRKSELRARPIASAGVPKFLWIAVAVILICAAALWLVPESPLQLGRWFTPKASEPASGTQVQEDFVPQGVVTDPSMDEPATGVDAAPLPLGEALGSASVSEAASSAPASVASADLSGGVATPTQPLQFVATDETWVTVRDATGKAIVNRALKAGDTLGVNGALPFAVTVGRKSAVNVTVRGKPFDIRSVGASKVARFTVE